MFVASLEPAFTCRSTSGPEEHQLPRKTRELTFREQSVDPSLQDQHARAQAAAAIDVTSWDLRLEVTSFATGWQTALQRPPKIKVESVDVCARSDESGVDQDSRSATAGAQLHVSRVARMGRAGDVAASSSSNCGPAQGDGAGGQATSNTDSAAQRHHQVAGSAVLRVAAPAGIAGPCGRCTFRSSRFPISSKASPSCIRGTRPSWPTKWAWARRCRRSRRSGCCCAAAKSVRVLLICPKPLVTNWQREFALWAPELPLGVIEGDQQRRRWQWRQTEPAREDRQLRAAAARRPVIAG